MLVSFLFVQLLLHANIKTLLNYIEKEKCLGDYD